MTTNIKCVLVHFYTILWGHSFQFFMYLHFQVKASHLRLNVWCLQLILNFSSSFRQGGKGTKGWKGGNSSALWFKSFSSLSLLLQMSLMVVLFLLERKTSELIQRGTLPESYSRMLTSFEFNSFPSSLFSSNNLFNSFSTRCELVSLLLGSIKNSTLSEIELVTIDCVKPMSFLVDSSNLYLNSFCSINFIYSMPHNVWLVVVVLVQMLACSTIAASHYWHFVIISYSVRLVPHSFRILSACWIVKSRDSCFL